MHKSDSGEIQRVLQVFNGAPDGRLTLSRIQIGNDPCRYRRMTVWVCRDQLRMARANSGVTYRNIRSCCSTFSWHPAQIGQAN